MNKNNRQRPERVDAIWPPRPVGQLDENTETMIQKPSVVLNIVDACLSYFPLCWVGFFVSFCIYASLLLGRLPIAEIDDPGFIGKGSAIYVWLDAITCATGLLLPFAVIASAIVKARHKEVLLTKKQKVRLVLFAVGVLLLIVIAFVDPWSRLRWFLD